MTNLTRTSLQLAALTVLAAGLVACDPEQDPVDTGCYGQLAGAVTGSFSCVADASYDSTSSTSTLRFDVRSVSGGALDVLLDGVTFDGVPVPGTLTEATPGIAAYDNVMGGTTVTPIGYFTVRNTYPFQDLGTFDLTLTSADPAASGAYVTHGTLSATLVPYPANDSAGTVTLDITF